MKEPLVSIIIPAFNQERFLHACLTSVLKQTYKNTEIIIVDDASTDSTPLIIQQYIKSHNQISVIGNKHKMGYGGEAAFNIGIHKARGQYIAKIDADDLMKNTRIEKQVAFLEKNKDIFLVGSWIEIIDGAGRHLSYRRYPTEHSLIYKNIYLRNPIANPSIMFRNEIMEDFFPIRFPRLNDYYAHFRQIYKGKKYANIPEYLTLYRKHESNTIYSDIKKNWKTNLNIKNTFIDEYNFKPTIADRIIISSMSMIVKTLPNRILSFILNYTPWK